jgi:hypothetical protein
MQPHHTFFRFFTSLSADQGRFASVDKGGGSHYVERTLGFHFSLAEVIPRSQ